MRFGNTFSSVRVLPAFRRASALILLKRLSGGTGGLRNGRGFWEVLPVAYLLREDKRWPRVGLVLWERWFLVDSLGRGSVLVRREIGAAMDGL